MNTRISYAGSNAAYQDNADSSVLAGELSEAHIRRLALGSFAGDISSVCAALGLAQLRNSGSGVRLQTDRIVPTLEAVTNPRADAATLYATLIALFAIQAARVLRTPQNFAEAQTRIGERLEGKNPVQILNTKRGLLSVQSDQAFVAGWLRSGLGGYVRAAAILSPLQLPIPDSRTARAEIERQYNDEVGNVEVIYLLPVAWATMFGGAAVPTELLRAILPDAAVTVGQAQAALSQASAFVSAVEVAVRSIGG